MCYRALLFVFLVIVSLLVCGCQKRSTVAAPQPFGSVEVEYVLCVVLDMSGSFADEMIGDDARAYHLFMQLSDDFFRQRLGSDDRILITQLSADDRTLLWEGSPASLRRRFPDPQAFATFLRQHSNPNGSRVYSAVADSLNYLSSRPEITESTTVLTVVLSDLVNFTDGNEDQEKQELLDALVLYRETGGHLALYFVDQSVASLWRQILTDARLPASVSTGIVEDPVMPEFDY